MSKVQLPILTRSQWLVLGSFATALVILLIVALISLGSFFSYREQVADLQPKLARMEGMLLAQDRIREAGMTADQGVEGLVYSDEDTNSIGVNMQQKLRSALSSGGMSVSGSNIQNAREFESLILIGVSITAEGTLAQLESVLEKIVRARPIVLIDRLEIRPERRRGADTSQVIEVQIQLYSMKLKND
ncbi:type II secretion system protein GspM [Gilvimarinus algae]|uniref:Type II secretion system protein GspM n=1 Tax=Gilvimarinus algae TaxID=3058037 RepID=A0ABT8THK6_9GAMM|nr:type II secretion system protein GspM [Gilvimarinus sp. SDUM040014]MDO3383579.1 type II secretion system protein GspM [Gilvimarinus sp. SDUM040014]